MDWWAKQNDEVDSMAKKFLRACKRSKRVHKPVQLWYKKWAIRLHGEKLANIKSKQLYIVLMQSTTLKYWQSYHTFPIKDPESVDWTSFGKALKRLPTGLQRFETKFGDTLATTTCSITANRFPHLSVKTVIRIWSKSRLMYYDANVLQRNRLSFRTWIRSFVQPLSSTCTW